MNPGPCDLLCPWAEGVRTELTLSARALLVGCVGKPSLPSELVSRTPFWAPSLVVPQHILCKPQTGCRSHERWVPRGSWGRCRGWLETSTAPRDTCERCLRQVQRGGWEASQPLSDESGPPSHWPAWGEQGPTPQRARCLHPPTGGLVTSWCYKLCPGASPLAESRSQAHR